MNRKEFLRGCAGGLCACAAFALIKPAAASNVARNAASERDAFIKERYAKLWEILPSHMSETDCVDTLRRLGQFCATAYDTDFAAHRGDVEGYADLLRAGGFAVTEDRGAITVSSTKWTGCACPLSGRASETPGIVCNCSAGWWTHAWESVMQRKVQVTVKETFLRGGDRCTMEIRPV
jgi:hypothetical protein